MEMNDRDRLLLLWEMEKERKALLERVEALINSRNEISEELAHLSPGLYPVDDGVFCEVVLTNWRNTWPFLNMIDEKPPRKVDFRFIKMQEADGDNEEDEVA